MCLDEILNLIEDKSKKISSECSSETLRINFILHLVRQRNIENEYHKGSLKSGLQSWQFVVIKFSALCSEDGAWSKMKLCDGEIFSSLSKRKRHCRKNINALWPFRREF